MTGMDSRLRGAGCQLACMTAAAQSGRWCDPAGCQLSCTATTTPTQVHRGDYHVGWCLDSTPDKAAPRHSAIKRIELDDCGARDIEIGRRSRAKLDHRRPIDSCPPCD